MQRTTDPVIRHQPRAAAAGLARKPGWAFLVIFAISCSIRVLFLTKLPEDYIRPNTRWELPAIAVSLAETGRFADPYALPTGPTAHLPPIPPAMAGLIYRMFGLTLAAGYVRWLVEIAIYSAVCGMLPWLGGRLGLGVPAGLVAGTASALLPRWAGHGEGLAAASLGLLMVAFVGRWTGGGSTGVRSLLLGMASGVAFHVQPALLLVVLGWMAFELWWSKDRRKHRLLAVMTLGMVIACLPWGWRNYRELDAVFFIRSNLGLELRMGNHEGAAAAMEVMDRMGREYIHPRAQEEEARKVQEMGEAAYMRQAGREALEWMVAHPGRFVELTASRAAHWWLGPLYHPPTALATTALTVLALVGAWLAFPALSVPQRAGLVIPLVTYPLIYYLVAYMPRYREPVDWVFFLLAAAAVSRWLVPARRAGAILEPGSWCGELDSGRPGCPERPKG